MLVSLVQRTFLIFIFLLLSQEVSAAGVNGQVYDNFHSVRAMGMGNAYSAIVSDSDALFYNPAGIARIAGFNWTIADPWVGVSGVEAFEDVQDIQDSDTFADSVNALYGDRVWLGAGLKSTFGIPYFAVGVYDHLNASLDINNPVYPNLDIAAVNDYGYVMGLGIPILPVFELGFVLKYIQRTGARVPFGPSFVSSLDPDSIRSNVERKGTGYGLDLGANFRIPGPLSMVLSGVWKNVGEMSFRPDSGEPPPSEPNEMNVAAAVELDVPLLEVRPTVEFKHLNRSDIQLGKKIHLGLEVSLPLIDVRGGFHQGYYTAGAGVNLGVLRVDVATWGVEMGDYPGQKEDRRYAVQATIELGFDPNLSFLGGGSGGSGGGSSANSPFRRLKQRR